MKIIEIYGEIGWDIYPEDVAEKLKSSQRDDITVRFSSIGGSVFDGADIMNLFKDHKRDNPGIKMNLELKAVAASMGSAIAASPVWDSVGVDATTGYMIHNPSSFAFGDFREMQSMADYLEAMRAAYSLLYSGRSGKKESEIMQLMDKETWYFGQSIIDNGFADVLITAETEGGEELPLFEEPKKDETIIIIEMKKKFQEMKNHQKQREAENAFDKNKAAASLSVMGLKERQEKKEPVSSITEPSKPQEPAIVASENNPGEPGEKQREVSSMTLDELKKENPDVYAAAMKDGAAQYKAGNDERVKALIVMKSSDEYKDIPEVVAVIDKAIEDGTDVSAVQPLMMAAMMKVMKDPARMAALESPGALGGSSPAVSTDEKRAEV